MASSISQIPRGNAAFISTRWSLVTSAATPADPNAAQALASLCELYWFPLYVFIRRRGYDVEQAQDLTQGFFARLLEKRDFVSASPERGRFRTFLLCAVERFLANEYDKTQTQKRGGDFEILSLDFQDAEHRYAQEPLHNDTPEKAYVQRWVLTLLDNILGRLREEMTAEDRLPLYEKLKPFLSMEGTKVPYQDLARQLGISESAAKVAVHRLRRRYRDLLREQVGHTLADPGEIRDEIIFLLESLRS